MKQGPMRTVIIPLRALLQRPKYPAWFLPVKGLPASEHCCTRGWHLAYKPLGNNLHPHHTRHSALVPSWLQTWSPFCPFLWPKLPWQFKNHSSCPLCPAQLEHGQDKQPPDFTTTSKCLFLTFPHVGHILVIFPEVPVMTNLMCPLGWLPYPDVWSNISLTTVKVFLRCD